MKATASTAQRSPPVPRRWADFPLKWTGSSARRRELEVSSASRGRIATSIASGATIISALACE